jgi:AraC-like DNA-binding protein
MTGSPNSRGFTPDDAPSSTTLVCGFIGIDVRPFNPLLATLPRMLHLPAKEGGEWSAQFVQFAAAESKNRRPGSEALLERLSEMMFVDAVRRHAERMPEQSTGWLAALRDRFVGRALALLHEKPAAPWTVDDLASRIGLSRSALAERFVELIGQPPMQYLTQWRMQVASRLLRDTQAPVASIALEVGYDSEAAFSRAFKRLTGVPPAAWRRSQAQAPAAAASAPAAGAELVAPPA